MGTAALHDAIVATHDSHGADPRPVDRAVWQLYARLTRRSVVILALAAAAYAVLEVWGYQTTYPDEASRASLAMFTDQPAVRMLQGVPRAVDTAGGFAVWDAGWFLQAVVGIWALVTVGRWLRGEEDAARVEWVTAGAIPASRAVCITTAVVLTGCVAVGVSVAAVLLALQTQILGAVLFGFGLAGFGATFAALAAVTSQIFDGRRRAVGVAAVGLGAAFLLRMAANAEDSRSWLNWGTPYGWLDQLGPFGDNRWPVLLLYVAATALLTWLAVRLRGRRDTGAGMIAVNPTPKPHLRELHSAMAFAWRSNRGVLLGWAVGLALYSFFMGMMVKTMIDFLSTDENYRKVFEQMGLDVAQTTEGFLGMMGIISGLVCALYVVWRLGAARVEESSLRLEHLLTRSLPRWRWLAGHVVLTAGAALLLALVTGVALWVGAVVTGAEVELSGAVASTLNPMSTVVLFGGLTVLVFGVAPRLTVGLPVAVAVVAYVLALLGPALQWPGWVLGLSPFDHLAYVPAQDLLIGPALVMIGIGVIAGAMGFVAFERRDLAGS